MKIPGAHYNPEASHASRRRRELEFGPSLDWETSRVVGRNARALRRALEWLPDKVATPLGVADKTVSRMETGERRFRRGDSAVLAKLFGVPEHRLYDASTAKRPETALRGPHDHTDARNPRPRVIT
jgi:hypothetical protein